MSSLVSIPAPRPLLLVVRAFKAILLKDPIIHYNEKDRLILRLDHLLTKIVYTAPEWVPVLWEDFINLINSNPDHHKYSQDTQKQAIDLVAGRLDYEVVLDKEEQEAKEREQKKKKDQCTIITQGTDGQQNIVMIQRDPTTGMFDLPAGTYMVQKE